MKKCIICKKVIYYGGTKYCVSCKHLVRKLYIPKKDNYKFINYTLYLNVLKNYRQFIITCLLEDKKYTLAEIAEKIGASKQRVEQMYRKRKSINKSKKHFLLNKFKHRCVKCKSTENLEAHHIDRDPSNNSIDNLIILCKKCHLTKHKNI